MRSFFGSCSSCSRGQKASSFVIPPPSGRGGNQWKYETSKWLLNTSIPFLYKTLRDNSDYATNLLEKFLFKMLQDILKVLIPQIKLISYITLIQEWQYLLCAMYTVANEWICNKNQHEPSWILLTKYNKSQMCGNLLNNIFQIKLHLKQFSQKRNEITFLWSLDPPKCAVDWL